MFAPFRMKPKTRAHQKRRCHTKGCETIYTVHSKLSGDQRTGNKCKQYTDGLQAHHLFYEDESCQQNVDTWVNRINDSGDIQAPSIGCKDKADATYRVKHSR